MLTGVCLAVLVVLPGATGPAGVSAQDHGPNPELRALLHASPPGSTPAGPAGEPAPPLVPAALSLVLPGAGQHVLGQRRTWVYAALEVAGWAVFLERRSAGADARDRYRDYAWEEGRIQTGSRVDGPFAYYEAMSKWTSSGAFDADPGTAGVQPETDPSTYNGSIWTRAAQIYIPGGGPVAESDPGYQDALSYYSGLAYHTAFLWDWSGVPGGKEELAELIEITDHRFRQATTAVGVVIANHLISAADAYLAARGRAVPVDVRIVPDAPAGVPAWSAVLSVPVGP